MPSCITYHELAVYPYEKAAMKLPTIVFPADYFDKSMPDEAFLHEYDAAVKTGNFNVALLDFELLESTLRLKLKLNLNGKAPASHSPLIYRGWMMKPQVYRAFFDALQALDLEPITTPEQYEEFHLYPLAYSRHKAIQAHSPLLLSYGTTTIDVKELNRTLDRLMIKDYVKSVKGTAFPSCISTPLTQHELDELISDFINRRGDLFTEGIVFKEFVDLKRYGETTNEWRAFYFHGALLGVHQNSGQASNSPQPPNELIDSCKNLGSPYYTVDFAERGDGAWIILETGDGQVSGLALSQDPDDYYQALAGMLPAH